MAGCGIIAPQQSNSAHLHRPWRAISRAQRHVIRRLHLEIAGWPRWRRPLRVAFLSDLHTGSHSDDVVRLNAIVHDVAALAPDLVLYGGDYVNMQPFGGGRVPPRTIAAILSRLEAPLGRFAILGNHDYVYDARAVIDALSFAPPQGRRGAGPTASSRSGANIFM